MERHSTLLFFFSFNCSMRLARRAVLGLRFCTKSGWKRLGNGKRRGDGREKGETRCAQVKACVGMHRMGIVWIE